jgi:hypothetical protein
MLHSCMSWTPANSIGTRAAHPSRIRVLSELRESTDLFRSYREGFDLVGKDPSPGYDRLFACRSTPLSPFFSTFAHRLRAERGDARAHSRKWKWTYSAQFWCNLSPLDATLLRPLLCVANKELARYLSSLDATLTRNIGGWGVLLLTSYPMRIAVLRSIATKGLFSTSHQSRITPVSPEAPIRA